MKKTYYLLTLLAVAVAFTFTACNPMDQKYKELGDLPKPGSSPVTITLANADYALLPTGNYAKTSFYFKTEADAKSYVPLILASKYPAASDKAIATVTYAVTPVTIKLADSLFTHLTYTLVNPDDYKLVLGASAKYFDLSPAQILTFLNTSPLYASPAPNQLAILTYINFVSGVSATVTESFLYLNGAWQNIYMVSPAQYTSVGKGGTNNDFASGDAALLPSYFNTFLKADPAVSVTAKAGDVKYVSYKYYGGSAGTFQRVLPLTFDGTNWSTNATSATLNFAKTNGTWVADNTVNYTLTTADMKSIGTNQPNVASAAAVANLASYGNYNIQGGATTWTDDQIATSISVFLKTKYTTAVVNQKFVITYAAYNGANIAPVKTFIYDGTTFKFQKP